MGQIARTLSPYCTYFDFVGAFHPAYRPSLTAVIQRSKRGTFPAFIRLENKASPALFLRSEILEYTEKTMGDAYPSSVEDVRKALGLPKKVKKKTAKVRP